MMADGRVIEMRGHSDRRARKSFFQAAQT